VDSSHGDARDSNRVNLKNRTVKGMEKRN